MGVYYTAYVAFGFPAPEVPEEEERWEYWDEYTPHGFVHVDGGNWMSSEDHGAVYCLPHHVKRVLDSSNSGFGVYGLGELITVTDEERERIIEAARELGVDDQQVGFYAVSSVG